MKEKIIIIFLIISFKSFSQTKTFIEQPYIETEVEIDSLIIPDRVYLTIVLNESDNKNKKSTEEMELSMNKVLISLNVDIENDLALLDFSSDFKKYFLSGQNILKMKLYSLLLRDANTAVKVLAELEKVGISNVSIERTEYSKSKELLLELKSKAVLKSKEFAESMIKPLNQKIGKAIYVSDVNSASNQLQGNVAGIRIRGASSLSSLYGSRANESVIEFNKIKFTTMVNVKYIIE